MATLTAALHLATVYIPMAGWLVTVLRLVAYLIALPFSILALLGLVRSIEAHPAPTNRTDAILTLLAFLGALLPILVTIFVRQRHAPARSFGGAPPVHPVVLVEQIDQPVNEQLLKFGLLDLAVFVLVPDHA